MAYRQASPTGPTDDDLRAEAEKVRLAARSNALAHVLATSTFALLVVAGILPAVAAGTLIHVKDGYGAIWPIAFGVLASAPVIWLATWAANWVRARVKVPQLDEQWLPDPYANVPLGPSDEELNDLVAAIRAARIRNRLAAIGAVYVGLLAAIALAAVMAWTQRVIRNPWVYVLVVGVSGRFAYDRLKSPIDPADLERGEHP